MKLNPIVLSALAVAASSPSISAAPFPAGSGNEGNPDTVTTPQPNENLSPRADIGQFARRASMRGGQRRSSGKHAKEKVHVQERESADDCVNAPVTMLTHSNPVFFTAATPEKKVKRADLLGSLGGGGAPPSAELAGYQSQVQSGLTGLGLGQLGGPVNGVLGTASGLESSVQGTLNGLGLGAVNGVAKSVLGTINGLEDSVQGTVKGLGLPEPLGSTVNNVITTAKGVQGQALSQLNVLPQGSSSGEGAGHSDPLSQLNGLGLAGLTGIAGGVLQPVSGLSGQGNAAGNGQQLPKLDPAILAQLLSTPNGLAALNSLTPSQLSSLGIGQLGNTASAPLSAINGLQGQLQGLGLGDATGALRGLTTNTPLSGLTSGATGDPASSLRLPQSPLDTLSSPQAVQKLLQSQAQEIAQLEHLVQAQNQKLAAAATAAGVPVSWPNVPTDQARAALANSGLGDTASVPGVFDSSLYNNKMARPNKNKSVDESKMAKNGDTTYASAPAATPEASATTAVPVDADSALFSVWDSTASALAEATTTVTPALQPLETFDPNGKVFMNVNPSRASAMTGFMQTTSGWPWPMDPSNLPPPVPAFTSWGVKMAGANASAKKDEVTGSSRTISVSGTPTISALSAVMPEQTSTSAEYTPMPSPTGGPKKETEEGGSNRMEKRSKNTPKEDAGGDIPGYENQAGTALNPMVPEVSSYLHDYVASYEAPDSPTTFHSAPSTPQNKSPPTVSGGVEGPQVVLGDGSLPPPTTRQSRRRHEDAHDDAETTSEVPQGETSDSQEGAHVKRQDDEEEHEEDPAEDNSENNPPAEPEAAPEPEEDPVTVSSLPDTPVPLPKTLPAQPALHSKAHRVHKKHDGTHNEEKKDDHHYNSMAFSAASPGGRPAMRRQQAYSPEHREHHKHDGGKDNHIHIHYEGRGRGGHHHKRDEGHEDEPGPELPAAPIADPAGASTGGDAQKSADYVGSHAQMSPDCWEAMAAGKHMEHTQKQPGKLRRRNAMPDLANAASGKQ